MFDLIIDGIKLIGVDVMGRPSWHYDHPPACTCVSCTENRLKDSRGVMSRIVFFFSCLLNRIFRK